MATCQDLVDAVTQLNSTQQSILEEVQSSNVILADIKESLNDAEKHLGFRLPSRGLWDEFFKQVVSAINLGSDVVAERVAQHTQAAVGTSGIPASDVPEIPQLDVTLDINTPGTTVPV